MQSAYFLIWCGIAVLIVGFGVLAYCVIQLRHGADATSERIDRVLAQFLAAQTCQGTIDSNFETRITSLQSWASSWVTFQEKIAKSHDAKVDELNKRLIELETENKTTPPKKHDDDDPLGGPRSWNAQAMAASRGEGVEYIG
jgi:hypothetical protein